MHSRPINSQLKKIMASFYLGVAILILGMRKCGKSYLAQILMSVFPRIIIIDLMGEPDFNKLPMVNNLKDFTLALKNLKNEKRFVLVYRFSIFDKNEKKLETFDQICKLVYAFGNVCLNIEECDNYCSNQFIPEWWEHLLRRGRHRKVSLIMSTQSPSGLNKMVVKQSDHKFIGMLDEANDLNYAANIMPGQRENLMTLVKRWFIHCAERICSKITTEA